MILYTIAIVFIAYLAIGHFLHSFIFSEARPNPKDYFKPGDKVESGVGGTSFTVTQTEGENVSVILEMEPHAEGPPSHIHTGWDETFAVKSGKMALMVEDEKKILASGESFTVPKGIPHKPYNPFNEKAILKETSMSAQFLVYLSQVYGFLEEDERNSKPPRIIFQMAVMNRYFDSYLADGPPVFLQKTINFVLTPLARLLGYKSFYEKYRL